MTRRVRDMLARVRETVGAYGCIFTIILVAVFFCGLAIAAAYTR